MDTLNHHSESKVLQKRFSEDRDKLIEEFFQTRNPFDGYKDITSLQSKIAFPCSSDIYKVEELGNASLKNFVIEVIIDNKRSVFDPIKQNNTGFLRRQPSRMLPKYWQRNPQTFLLTCLLLLNNEIPTKFQSFLNGKLHYHQSPPSLTIPTTGKVCHKGKRGRKLGFFYGKASIQQ